MKKSFCSVALLAFALLAQAHTNFSLELKHQLQKMQSAKAAAQARGAAVREVQTLRLVGTLNEGEVTPAGELQTLGIEVIDQIGPLVFMQVPVDQIEALGQFSAFKRINIPQKFAPKNQASHQMTSVDRIQDADNLPEGLNQTYTGQGVVVGIIDQGFDYQHKMFRGRIKKVWVSDADVTKLEDKTSQLATLTTDDSASSHGTHVAGTATGADNGDYLQEDGSIVSGQQGTAFESDILLASPQGDDYLILDAISKMRSYAEAEGKPLVINISLGSNDAWMDGLSEMCSGIASITENGDAEGLVINVAAGNEGGDGASFFKSLQAGESITTAVSLESESEKSIQLVSEDATPFQVTLQCWGEDGSEVVESYTDDEITDFNGSGTDYTAEIDETHDGRYAVMITIPAEYTGDGLYWALNISAEQACGVRMWSKETPCSNAFGETEVSGFFKPADDNSLNTMAQTKAVFAVGACTSTLEVVKYDGYIESSENDALGKISSFSSWSEVPYKNQTDAIGVDFLSPGDQVVSSINYYDQSVWANNKPVLEDGVCSMLVGVANDNSSHKNFLGVMQGTSMATPNATGIMALWLEADPKLSINQIRQIIQETADNDEYTTDAFARRAGAGRINALQGLLKVLENNPSGIQTIGISEPSSADGKFVNGDRIVVVRNGVTYNAAGQRLDH